MNKNIQGDFQICIGVPLSQVTEYKQWHLRIKFIAQLKRIYKIIQLSMLILLIFKTNKKSTLIQ